jgi:hypothetical protein
LLSRSCTYTRSPTISGVPATRPENVDPEVRRKRQATFSPATFDESSVEAATRVPARSPFGNAQSAEREWPPQPAVPIAVRARVVERAENDRGGHRLRSSGRRKMNSSVVT